MSKPWIRIISSAVLGIALAASHVYFYQLRFWIIMIAVMVYAAASCDKPHA